jgi:murein DD-endopeptidase
MGERLFNILIFCCNAFLLSAPIAFTENATAGAAQPRPPLTQSLDIRSPSSPTVVNIAGKSHLIYELYMANFNPIDITLTSVEIMDADRNIRVAYYKNSDLDARIGHPGSSSKLQDNSVIAGGTHAVLYFWIALDDTTSIPKRLKHKIEFDLFRSSRRETGVVESESLNVWAERPAILNPPLRGGPWVALYDPMMARGHRTSIYTMNGKARIPARFAIDWILLKDDATHAQGDESKITNWHGYGAEVLAVADGIVSEARDDIAEEELIGASQVPVRLENASGNYITLDLGKGRYAFYEHLKHDSIRVKRGDRVKSGQVVGQLGNSGSSSSGPHLHFHVSDANSTLGAEGLPYVLENFVVLGAFETIDDFVSGKRWSATSKGLDGTRRRELPAANTVIMLPKN